LIKRIIHQAGPFPLGAFYCMPINGTTTQFTTLIPAYPFSVKSYKICLLDDISSLVIKGFSSFHIILYHMPPLIPRWLKLPHQTHFGQSLQPSRVIDRLGDWNCLLQDYFCIHYTMHPAALPVFHD